MRLCIAETVSRVSGYSCASITLSLRFPPSCTHAFLNLIPIRPSPRKPEDIVDLRLSVEDSRIL